MAGDRYRPDGEGAAAATDRSSAAVASCNASAAPRPRGGAALLRSRPRARTTRGSAGRGLRASPRGVGRGRHRAQGALHPVRPRITVSTSARSSEPRQGRSTSFRRLSRCQEGRRPSRTSSPPPTPARLAGSMGAGRRALPHADELHRQAELVAIATATPPRADRRASSGPPRAPADSPKSRACWRRLWPVVASTTSSVSCGAPSSRPSITRLTFAAPPSGSPACGAARRCR